MNRVFYGLIALLFLSALLNCSLFVQCEHDQKKRFQLEQWEKYLKARENEYLDRGVVFPKPHQF